MQILLLILIFSFYIPRLVHGDVTVKNESNNPNFKKCNEYLAGKISGFKELVIDHEMIELIPKEGKFFTKDDKYHLGKLIILHSEFKNSTETIIGKILQYNDHSIIHTNRNGTWSVTYSTFDTDLTKLYIANLKITFQGPLTNQMTAENLIEIIKKYKDVKIILRKKGAPIQYRSFMTIEDFNIENSVSWHWGVASFELKFRNGTLERHPGGIWKYVPYNSYESVDLEELLISY